MKRLFSKISAAILILISFLIVLSSPASAAPNLKDAFKRDSGKPLQAVAEQGGNYLPGVALETIAGKIIMAILSLLGVVFIILIIYGGFLYMTASGNEDQAKKGRTIIVQSVIGLIIVLAAYAISYFIINVILNANLI